MNDERYVLAELKRELLKRHEKSRYDTLYAVDVLAMIAGIEASAVLGYEEEPQGTVCKDDDLPWSVSSKEA